MTDTPAIEVRNLKHAFGQREALRGVALTIEQGECFALLGPNGSGKTTLFRLLSTLLPIQSGAIRVLGADVATQPAEVRSRLGVVFQSPSLDKKLRVEENLRCHGRLYGIGAAELSKRVDEGLARFGLNDRRRDFVETLSGGLARRIELAQSLLHQPRVLVLDEPSTGLDPAARSDLWRALAAARESGVTVVVTTHLLEEAERVDRLAILHQGQVAALDTPAALQASLGGDAITLRPAGDPASLAEAIRLKLNLEAAVVDGSVRVDAADGAGATSELYSAFRDQIEQLSVGKPTLEDVFIARTGHRFYAADSAEGES